MPVNERTLTTKCIRKARQKASDEELPIFLSKIHAGPHQPIGLPDVIGCCWGVFIGIEMKAPGKEGRLTQRQEKKLRDIAAAGGVEGVATSWDEFWDLIEECKKKAGPAWA